MNASRTRPDPNADACRELLSALHDGDAAALEGGCAAWRDDAQSRATWHAYHLIGDVLRSDDLASTPARDAAFLAALRMRLADEPVIVAPATERPRRQAWLMPLAAAAGFVAVAGVMVVVRSAAPVPAGETLAAGPAAPAASVTLASNGGGAPSLPVYPGQLIRDPQLDRYLQAHRAALVGGAVAVPGGVPRSMEVLSPVTPAVAPVTR